VSSIGWAIGYIGGGLLLLLNLLAIISAGTTPTRRDRPLEHRLGRRVVGRVHHAAAAPLRNRAGAGEHHGYVLVDGFRQLWPTLKTCARTR
jgi:UMF1 family MFS transporter